MMRAIKMTKGRALIEARRILGPSGHVRMNEEMGIREVGTFDARGFVAVAEGHEGWAELIDKARKSEAAYQWWEKVKRLAIPIPKIQEMEISPKPVLSKSKSWFDLQRERFAGLFRTRKAIRQGAMR